MNVFANVFLKVESFMSAPVRLLLVPLDERPVNTQYPRLTAAIAGVEVLLPPPDALPDLRRPGDRHELLAWLREVADGCDGAVVCLPSLIYGGLIASRISDTPAWEALAALSALDDLPRPLYVADLVMRVSRSDDDLEEPLYWNPYGSRLYAYSQALDAEDAPRIAAFEADIPATHRRDFLWRRARNHAINQAVLSEAARFDLLVIASDDTSPIGLPSRERRALLALRSRLGLTDHVLMYPGADELGCALTARLINATMRQTPPRVAVEYIIPEGAEIVAKYEDRPVRETVAGQLAAVGAVQVASLEEADLLLIVNPPSAAGQEWERVDQAHERRNHEPAIARAVERIARLLAEGREVAIADVAYPNGADPILIDHLFPSLPIAQLAMYGAWNTAGNTIGSVLAGAVVPVRDVVARRCYLAHRFLEDWGYQQVVRHSMRAKYGERFDLALLPQVTAEVAAALEAPRAQLAVLGLDYALTEVRLPWQRLFEVDFVLTAVDGGGVEAAERTPTP
jgi:hypothetical protein